MSSKPVALILGAGPRVGAAVASKFIANFYSTVIVSRKGKNTVEGTTSLAADLSEPASIPGVFRHVKEMFGVPPSVVIYNAAAMTPPPIADSMFSIPVESFGADLNINTVSAYVAAQEAVKGWYLLPKETKKTFIYTGNILNTTVFPVPMMMTLGVGKSASAYWIGVADASYSALGARWVDLLDLEM